MKKNLIALAALLVLVAVAAQFTRNGGKKSEWVALENDMQACLQLLWQQPDQKVEIMPSEGGPVAFVIVHMPPQAKAGWNFPFLNLVAARHPAVQLKGMDIRDGLTGNPIPEEVSTSAENSLRVARPDSGDSGRRAELLRRQAQAVVDQQLGAGQGLILVDVQEVASPISATPANLEPAFERPMQAAPEAQGKSAPSFRRRMQETEGMRADQATSPPPPQFQVQASLVLATQTPPEKLAQIRGFKLMSGVDDIRIVTLPPL